MGKYKSIPEISKDMYDTKYRYYMKPRKHTHGYAEFTWDDVFDYYTNKFVLTKKESVRLMLESTRCLPIGAMRNPHKAIFSELREDRHAYLTILEQWQSELDMHDMN
jgi:hypothetical protein